MPFVSRWEEHRPGQKDFFFVPMAMNVSFTRKINGKRPFLPPAKAIW